MVEELVPSDVRASTTVSVHHPYRKGGFAERIKVTPGALNEARGAREHGWKRVSFIVRVAGGGGPLVAYGIGVLRPPRDGLSAPTEEEGLFFPLDDDDSLGFYLLAKGVWQTVDYGGAVHITIDNCELPTCLIGTSSYRDLSGR